MSRKYSRKLERLRLSKLERRSCAWGRRGYKCASCIAMQDWRDAVSRMSCSDWPEYRDCKMSNDNAVAFLQHVKRCPRCWEKREALRRRREKTVVKKICELWSRL